MLAVTRGRRQNLAIAAGACRRFGSAAAADDKIRVLAAGAIIRREAATRVDDDADRQ